MLKFNRKTRTKDGKELIPFLIEGQTVYCFDSKNNTVIKQLSDFENVLDYVEKDSKTVTVTAISEMSDQLFEPSDDLVVEVKPSAPPKEVVPVEPEPTPPKEVVPVEPEPEPEPEPPTDPFGGISNDDYI